MATELRPDAAVIGPSESEEHRHFIELLREGYEDVQAERVVTNEELERILDDARARRLSEWLWATDGQTCPRTFRSCS